MRRRERAGMGRRTLFLVLSVSLLGPAGCGDGRPDARSDAPDPASAIPPAPADEEILTVLHSADERLFGPSHDGATKFLVFLPLTDPAVADADTWRETIDGGRCPGPVGALAESWRHSDDYRTWTIRLREGIRWHDGEPVTSRDVVFTVELWQHPEVGHYAAAGLDSAMAIDERTVRFHLERAGDWPLGGWSVIYPEHLLGEKDPADFYEWTFWTRPVGNGPYRYVRHEPGTMVELEANPAYHRGEPAIDRLRIQLGASDRSTGLVELRAGNVDLLQVGLAEAELLADDPRFRAHHGVAFAASTWLLWNRRHPLLEDVQGRRALTHAVDRRALQALLRIPEDGIFVTEGPYTTCQFRQQRILEPWPHDLQAARRLLRESGWEDVDGDGVREREGREARFTLIADERERRKAVFVQGQLRQVGVRAEVAILDPSLIHDRIRSGEFDAAIRTRGLAGTTNFLRDTVRLGPVPADIREMATAIRSEADAARRDSMYLELARLVRADLPVTWLAPRPRAVVARREVQGLRLPDGGLRPAWRWPFGGVEFLRLADGAPEDRE